MAARLTARGRLAAVARALVLAAAAVALSPSLASADLFSPGELARAHADLEGLANCTRCHMEGQQLAQSRCLDCHVELKPQVEARRGLHGRLSEGERACEKCHREHVGRDAALVDWGRGGRDTFDHTRAGWPLEGAHAKAKCASCHERRRVREPAIVALLEKAPKRGTMLGLGQRCTDCHFDEHRGTVQGECTRCHSAAAWKPARGFDHAKSDFPLRGKHAEVECAKCHAAVEDTKTAAGAFPAPVARTFTKLGGIAHARCTDCHEDPHEGRLGAECTSCHTEADWHRIVTDTRTRAGRAFHERTRFPLTGAHQRVECARCHGPSDTQPKARWTGLPFAACTDCHADPHEGRFGATCTQCHTTGDWKTLAGAVTGGGDRAFHERSRFPLRGAHTRVECKACHGPFRSEPVRYRGLPFGACADCHADAHAGQLEARPCDGCHALEAFAPATFEREEHARTRYPLEDAHATVACRRCHAPDPALASAVPAAVRRRLAAQRRPERVSTARLALPDVAREPQRCGACHADPHGGQFEARADGGACAGCHRLTTFADVTFDHARGSRFPLEGAHRAAACASCHRAEPVAGGGARVRYRPLDVACDGCHVDVHVGQLARAGESRTDCTRCHGTDAFTPPRFEHAPPFTEFRLEGRHADVACAACHREVEVAVATVARQYKPLATRCAACHADPHEGAFASFDGGCAGCHAPSAWLPAAYPHERTGFPLRGAHADARCGACHAGNDFKAPLSARCDGCHRDVHTGALGARCADCHDERAWLQARFDVAAHRRTGFPLVGRHALLPCTECHGDTRDRAFVGGAVECARCHATDAARAGLTTLDHTASQLVDGCQRCHDGWRWDRPRFGAHEACFQLEGGEHAGLACRDCHLSLAGLTATGACSTGNASCTSCHEHTCARTEREHRSVPGYQCKDRKCYECHRFSE